MSSRTIRPLDWFWIALLVFAGLFLILGSAWQLIAIVEGAAPDYVYKRTYLPYLNGFQCVFRMILGMLGFALARKHYMQRSKSTI